MVIVILLVISAGVGVWSYWPEISKMISPSAPPMAPVAPAERRDQLGLPLAPKLRGSSPELKPRVGGVVSSGPRVLPALEDSATDEPEGALPEKLTPITIAEGEETKRMEKQILARQRRDEPSVIQDYLRMVRIGGVRVAGPMSKLILNGQVYQVGDVIQDNPKVVIKKITTAQVIFQDQQGNQYPVKY